MNGFSIGAAYQRTFTLLQRSLWRQLGALIVISLIGLVLMALPLSGLSSELVDQARVVVDATTATASEQAAEDLARDLGQSAAWLAVLFLIAALMSAWAQLSLVAVALDAHARRPRAFSSVLAWSLGKIGWMIVAVFLAIALFAIGTLVLLAVGAVLDTAIVSALVFVANIVLIALLFLVMVPLPGVVLNGGRWDALLHSWRLTKMRRLAVLLFMLLIYITTIIITLAGALVLNMMIDAGAFAALFGLGIYLVCILIAQLFAYSSLASAYIELDVFEMADPEIATPHNDIDASNQDASSAEPEMLE